MSYTEYSRMEFSIATQQPFKGNSASAEISENVEFGLLRDKAGLEAWLYLNATAGQKLYVVYSYNTPMLVQTPDSSSTPWVNREKYSTTTSRLQNIIKQVLA